MNNTHNENLETIRNSEKFIEIYGVLPLEQVEEFLIQMVTIRTNYFSNNENFSVEVEKIAKIFS